MSVSFEASGSSSRVAASSVSIKSSVTSESTKVSSSSSRIGGSNRLAFDGEDATTAFLNDIDAQSKSRAQRLKEIMAEAETDMDSMLARSKDARNAVDALPVAPAAGSHAGSEDIDVNLPERKKFGQEDPEPKSEMEKRINLRSKALQRGLPK